MPPPALRLPCKAFQKRSARIWIFSSFFVSRTRNVIPAFTGYMRGLFQSERVNMLRMSEVNAIDHQAMQHLLTDAGIDWEGFGAQIAKDTDALLGGQDAFLLLDESAFAKKGEASAGVARQWNGRLGKVDNCQVGVFATSGGTARLGQFAKQPGLRSTLPANEKTSCGLAHWTSGRMMKIDDIVKYVQQVFPGVQDDYNWGERALFYNPERRLPKGIYFLTFKLRDGASDSASKIMPGQYRLNVGISKRAFIERFGLVPPRPAAGGVVDAEYDFTVTDRVMPHPVYGWMAWVAVKNPTRETFGELAPLLEEAYRLAVCKFTRRVASAAGKSNRSAIVSGG